MGKRADERRQAILVALLDGPQEGMTGLDLCRTLNWRPGTIHPDLAWLEREEWISSYWQERPPLDPPDSRRRLYQLTPHGRTRVLAALDRYDWGQP